MSSPYTIRPALISDLPAIVRIDALASPNAPIVTIPWANIDAFYAAATNRYEWMLKRPDYKGVVACNPGEEKVVGFLIWKRPKKEGEELEEWTPKLPEGTNERFLGMFLSAVEREKGRWSVEDLFELESMSVLPEYERRGIASSLIRVFLQDVDKDGTGAFVQSSLVGRKLYEKFGWRLLGEASIDLSEFGLEKPYVTFMMRREGVKSAA